MEGEYIIQTTLESLPEAAAAVLKILQTQSPMGATVLALSGDLGAGKTTFVQAVAKKLGVTETVTSPTFTIMRQYETADPVFTELIHMDAYRIDDESELIPLRWETLRTSPQTLICVEWPEKIAVALPERYVHLSLRIVSEIEREITITTV